MSKTVKAVLCVALAVALLIVAGAVGLGVYVQTQNSYHNQLIRGQKYLEQQDYENAVLCYRAAVQEEPEEADGYLGLAQAYLGLNKVTLALNVLDTGVSMTGSQRLVTLLEQTRQSSSGIQSAAAVQLEEKDEASLNTRLLDVISGSTYDDYCRDRTLSGEESTADGYAADVEELGLRLTFRNTGDDPNAINRQTGKPYGSRRPVSVSVDDLTRLFGRSTVTYDELSAMKLTGLQLTENDAHGWVVTFRYQNCDAVIECDESGTVRGDSWNEFTPAVSDEDEEEEAQDNLRGRVINAQTGSGVNGAKLEFFSYGKSVAEEQSGYGGEYSAALEAGVYQVRVSCDGYIEEEITVTVNITSTQKDLVISPQLEVGEIRIVLEWGEAPSDLDSYLTGTTDGGETVATSFYNKKATGRDGRTLAELDVDEVYGYGPETTTLYETDGIYRFTVRDYNNTGTMGSSGATVKIYVGSEPPVTISITPNAVNTWLVCEIDHGEVRVLNQAA